MFRALLCCLFFAVTTAVAAPQAFVLRSPLNVWDVAVEDLDRDGTKDVLAVVCDEKSYPLQKMLLAYIADSEGKFPEQPSISVPLDPKVGTLLLAECTDTAPREIVLLDASGATVMTYQNGQFEQLASPRFSSLLPSGSKEPMFLEDAAVDLDGDGTQEWLIPMPTGYSVRSMDAEKALVQCDVISEIRRDGSTYISHRLPAYHHFDYADAKGLAFLSDEFADFAYGPGWGEHRRFKIPKNLDEKWEASSQMKDINQDGFPDLLVTQTKGTINLQALTQVYIASAPFTYPEQPSLDLSAKGGLAAPGLEDIDGDGMLDLVVINMSFGVKNLLNFFTRGKISVDAQVYLFKDGAYSPEPAYTTSLTLDAPEGRERVAYALGDFDGDGRKDVAFGQGAELFAVQRGEPQRFVEPKPWVSVPIPSFGTARAYALNADKKDDVVLFHPAGENAKRIEVVIF